MAHKSGWVRCGHCQEPFNAYAQRLSDPVEADSFIDVDAGGGGGSLRPDSPVPAGDPGAEQGPGEWTKFELVLDHDEDDDESPEAGDVEETDPTDAESETTGLDLDMSAFESDDPLPTVVTGEPATGEGGSGEADEEAMSLKARDEALKTEGRPEAAPDSAGGEADRASLEKSPVSPSVTGPGQEGESVKNGGPSAQDAGLEGKSGDSDLASQISQLERVVKPFLGIEQGASMPVESTPEQEVTIDPVFTVEEQHYDFAGQRKPARRRWVRLLVSAVLFLSLAGLLFWQFSQRYGATWSQDERLRPAIVQWCSMVNCVVPPLRDIGTVELVGTSIATHDEVAGALQVTIQLINRATFDQAFPALEISLTNREGGVVGRRTFRPGEFLGLGSSDSDLPSRQLISIVIDLADPPDTAVGYEVRIIDI
jgi:hypothetical protein